MPMRPRARSGVSRRGRVISLPATCDNCNLAKWPKRPNKANGEKCSDYREFGWDHANVSWSAHVESIIERPIMSDGEVRYSREGDVVTVVFDRPAARNA